MYELLQKEKIPKKKLIALLFEAYDSGVKMSQKLHEYAGKERIPSTFKDKK
jgi:hypothetical protein